MTQLFAVLKEKNNRLILLACLFAVCTLFINLGSGGIYAAQEGRTALIVRNMLLSQNYLDMNVPYGVPYEKPVGHYWMCLPFASLAHLDGEPLESAAEWALRLPSALSALLALILAGILAGRLYGKYTAAITIAILCTMPTFDKLGRLAHIDMPLAAAFTAAMFFLYIGYMEKMKCNGWIYGFYAMLGVGLLLKGPIVLILSGLTILAMMIWSKNWKMPFELHPWTGLAVFLLVGLPWYIAENIRTNGEFFNEFIWRQNILRFIGKGSTYRNGEWMPVWYYIPKLFAGTIPWSIFTLLGLLTYRKQLLHLRRLRSGTVFLIFWFLTGFVFFSFSALKRGDYLLPIYPALAILTARGIDLLGEKMPALHRKWIIVWGILAGLAALLLVLNLMDLPEWVETLTENRAIPFLADRDIMSFVMFSKYINAHLIGIGLLGVGLLGALYAIGKMLEKHRVPEAFFTIAASTLLIFILYHAAIEPGTDHLKTTKPFAMEAQKLIPKDAKVIYHDDFNTELIFFINRPYAKDLREAQDFIITTDEGEIVIAKQFPGKWEKLLETVPHHQYPAVLLRKIR